MKSYVLLAASLLFIGRNLSVSAQNLPRIPDSRSGQRELYRSVLGSGNVPRDRVGSQTSSGSDYIPLLPPSRENPAPVSTTPSSERSVTERPANRAAIKIQTNRVEQNQPSQAANRVEPTRPNPVANRADQPGSIQETNRAQPPRSNQTGNRVEETHPTPAANRADQSRSRQAENRGGQNRPSPAANRTEPSRPTPAANRAEPARPNPAANRVEQNRPVPPANQPDENHPATAASRPGVVEEIPPSPPGRMRYRCPDFYRGLYLNNVTVRMPTRYTELLRKAKEHGFNALVVDVQGVFPSDEFIRHARESGFYLIARVVVFEGGLKTLPIPARHIEGVINEAERSARSGFMEVQLDYIRFADNLGTPRATLAERYRTIEGILKSAAEKIHPLGVRLGADIFGRIAFNHDDWIGQNVELFSKHIDTIYPMLYPSHFYGESNRQRDPYGTVLEGTRNCVNRTAGRSKIVSYIQGFRYGAGVSGLPITDYIRHQLRAAVDSGGGGFVVWEANNDYSDLFRAMPQAH